MDNDAKEVLDRSNEYLNRVFSETDSELIDVMPAKLVFFAVHQILMWDFPSLTTTSHLVETQGADGHKAFYAEGIARAIESIIAKAWDRKHSENFITDPLPERFRDRLKLASVFGVELPL